LGPAKAFFQKLLVRLTPFVPRLPKNGWFYDLPQFC
jgi:hypothetical protein